MLNPADRYMRPSVNKATSHRMERWAPAHLFFLVVKQFYKAILSRFFSLESSNGGKSRSISSISASVPMSTLLLFQKVEIAYSLLVLMFEQSLSAAF